MTKEEIEKENKRLTELLNHSNVRLAEEQVKNEELEKEKCELLGLIQAKDKLIENKNRNLKGKNNPHYGIKVSEDQKKRQSEKMKGRHWYNNGEITISAFFCPEGFIRGRLNGGRK